MGDIVALRTATARISACGTTFENIKKAYPAAIIVAVTAATTVTAAVTQICAAVAAVITI